MINKADKSNSIAIQTHELSKSFGNRKAVDKLTIKIRQGEMFSLLGTNGAGKTTTIKMLCCILRPTSGGAEILGHQIGHDHLKIKEVIGVSPQETAITGHLSAWENLILMGGVFGLKRNIIRERARELMELMELTDRRKGQSRKLSGGMQRRLSIAMALMSDPEILFLDEPTLGLDPHARRSVWNYIEKLKGKKTILLTTHYLEEADALADTIAIMNKGQIIEMGTSYDIKKRFKKDQSLSIFTENISPAVIEGLKKMGPAVSLADHGIVMEAPELDFYAIIEYLRQNKIKIDGINMQEPTLDDVFIRLTGKEAQS
jgi:ABC-2 type transport system ATP-binding protein